MGRHSAPKRGLFRPARGQGGTDAAGTAPAPVPVDTGLDATSEIPRVVDGVVPGGVVPAGAAPGPVLPDVVLGRPATVLGRPATVLGRPATAATPTRETPTPADVTAATTESGTVATTTTEAATVVITALAAEIAAPDAAPAPGAPAATPPGRAGRNLPLAVGVGLGLGAVVLLPLFLYRAAFVVVVAVAVAVGIHEMVRAVQRVEARPPQLPVLAGGLGMTGLAFLAGPEALLVGLLLTVVALPVWRLADGPVGYQRDITAGALIAVYVPFLAGFCVLLTVPGDGALRATAFIATVVCSDVGGYAAGVLFGKHPMAPTVSPKKSWEGFAGSLVACAIGGVCFLVLGFDGQWWQGVLYGLAIAVAATLGDLAESMVKRDLHIKDMGSLLPGHGGLMDRLDSLLLAAPVAYLLLTTFAPPA